MYRIDRLTCTGCPRTLAQGVQIGPGSRLRFVCWGQDCGVVTALDAPANGGGINTLEPRRLSPSETVDFYERNGGRQDAAPTIIEPAATIVAGSSADRAVDQVDVTTPVTAPRGGRK